MHLKVKTQRLLAALQPATVASAQSAGDLIELQAAGDTLSVRGTDGELFVRRRVRVDSLDSAGKGTVGGRALLGLVRESGSNEAELELQGEKLLVHCAPGRYELLCAAGITLPELPEAGEASVQADAEALRRVLEMTAFAASSKEMRYAMNGVCLSVKRGVLRGAATDGRRLAIARARLKPGFKGEIIVPLRAVGELTRLLEESGGQVELRIGGNFLVISGTEGEVGVRLVEGRFPAYEEVIPGEDKVMAWVEKEELSRAMKSVSFLSSEEYRAARLSFRADGVTVEFGSPERGEGRMDIRAECTGGEVAVSLNPTFILDVLRVLPDEKVQVGLRDAEGAVVFRQGEDFLYVVMPISPGRGDAAPGA